jgi:small conductance mechanosensitive channel
MPRLAGLTAAVTSIGLSVGLASQKVLGNLAAGLMLLILRPFKKGDFVILGGKTMGVVHAISLFATQVDTINNVRIAVPNSEVYGTVVENYSKHRMRLVEVEVCTAPSGGVAEARRVIEQAIAKYAKYQDEEMMLRRIIKR